MTRKHALVAAPLVPEFDRESGAQRLFDFMMFLQEAGWSVTFVAKFRGPPQRYTAALQQRGIPVVVGFNKTTEKLLSERHFDLAILAFWSVAEELLPLLRRVSPDTRVIVDSIDVHFVRSARGIYQQQQGREQTNLLDSEYASQMIREMNSYAAADSVLAVSEKEAGLINDLTGDQTLAYVAPDCEEIEPSDLPFEQRKGILFVGSFRHPPNRDAVAYLCNLILPQLDDDILREHPVYVVGNGAENAVTPHNNTLSNVRATGWVPSVVPYLQRTRISVLPLLYGAGTKRKLVQALTVGTPTVSTSTGTEGLGLVHDEHVMVADDPVAFARNMTTLLRDVKTWGRLAAQGRAHIRATHSRSVARRALLNAVAATLDKRPKQIDQAYRLKLHRRGFNHPYDQLIFSIQDVVDAAVPLTSTIAVISRGDEDLVNLGGRKAWHFPRGQDGQYAGFYPATSEDAIEHLAALKAQGVDFLLVPNTSYWWFDHYRDFKQHLDRTCRVQTDEGGSCMIFSLREAPDPEAIAAMGEPAPAEAGVEADLNGHGADAGESSVAAGIDGSASLSECGDGVEPAEIGAAGVSASPAAPDTWLPPDQGLGPRPFFPPSVDGDVLARFVRDPAPLRVLALGIYLAQKPNHVHHIVDRLAGAGGISVTQRWVALGGDPPGPAIASVTAEIARTPTPKYALLNDLIARNDVDAYDYVLIVDDDILLPDRFVEFFIGLQDMLRFRIAQPARTSNSYTDLPIVERQRGTLARRTRFVEIGPVVSFHRSVYDLVFPFDLSSAMGWGYENVWSRHITERGLAMGIIDSVTVDHSLRKPVAHYAWSQADAGRTSFLRQHDHVPLDRCFRVLDFIALEDVERLPR